MALTNSERQALYRERRKAELDELRKAAATSRTASPAEPLRNTEPLRYGDVDREVEEIEATLEDVKSEFADLVQELGEFFDDFICGLGNLTNDCERLLGNRLQTLRNSDPDYDPDFDEDDPEYLAIKALCEKVERLESALCALRDENLGDCAE